MKKIFLFTIFLLALQILNAQTNSEIERLAALKGKGHVSEKEEIISSISEINWCNYNFSSNIKLNIQKSKIPMPSGKVSAVNFIERELPVLIKDPLLSINVDNTKSLSDLFSEGTLSLEQITQIINRGNKSPAFFYNNGEDLTTQHTMNLQEIRSILVKHKNPYTQKTPIKTVTTRAYTGIIIDARGEYEIQGEFITSEIYPCIFPCIYNNNMDLIFEKNMVKPEIAKENGIVLYSSSDFIEDYQGRVGNDPLWIKAKKVYGIKRTDPIISENDYLKITSNAENLNLIREGKIVILLDEKNLIRTVSVPEKNKNYYIAYYNLKRKIEEEKIPDLIISDAPTGLSISIQNLRFIADSAELLPNEVYRVKTLSASLKTLVENGNYTILVEGHTADVNKPEGQLKLSIERAKKIIDLLVEDGVDRNIFTFRGYGETKPIADNSTPEGRAQNRRVEIKAMPKSSSVMRD